MTDDADKIVSIAEARTKREAKKASRMIGNCARGSREECGMRDARECKTHGPLLPDAS